MKTLQVNLRDRNDPLYVNCDRYEVKNEGAAEGGKIEMWLVTYQGDKEMGRYRLADVIGYHEFE